MWNLILFRSFLFFALTTQQPLFQISDWLTLNREMLKQQSIPVGSIDTIAIAIDKQKVRTENPLFFEKEIAWHLTEELCDKRLSRFLSKSRTAFREQLKVAARIISTTISSVTIDWMLRAVLKMWSEFS